MDVKDFSIAGNFYVKAGVASVSIMLDSNSRFIQKTLVYCICVGQEWQVLSYKHIEYQQYIRKSWEFIGINKNI
jgi:hypothetical protein